MIAYIDEACAAGARLSSACRVLEISPRTLQRWRQGGLVKCDGRQQVTRLCEPANKLTEQERQHILMTANQPEFAQMSPKQIVPTLADQGVYIASESTFYRVLREANQLAHRGKAKPATKRRPLPLQANSPKQVWSWDITYLATNIKGMFFYLYLIMDIFSRKIVGWEVYETESAEHAAQVVRKAYLREGVKPDDLVLHSDNGSPMKAATMLGMLQNLGVMPSFSRPSVSNDNPYSESLFKTLKYRPAFPSDPFDTLQAAREWVSQFVHWYNEIHHHSALKFVTPGERHRGEDIAILRQRDLLYKAAKAKRPDRWSGETRNWVPDEIVYLNPNKSARKEAKNEDITT